jgi:hypothetical protein
MDYINAGEGENISAHREDQSDAEKKATMALTQLKELTYLISNHLGSPVDPDDHAEDVKVKKPASKKVDVFGVQFDEGPLGARSIPRGAAKPNKPQTMKKAYGKNKMGRDLTGAKYEKRGGDREPMESDVGPLGRGKKLGSKEPKSVQQSLPEMAASFSAIAQQVQSVNKLLGKLVEQEGSTKVSAKKVNRPADDDKPTEELY